MSSYFTDQRRLLTAVLDYDTADAEIVFTPTVPVAVSKIRIVLTEATSVAGSVVTFGVRAIDAAAGADITTIYGTFTVPAGAAAGTVYDVDVAYVDPDAVTSDGTGISQPAEVTTGRVVGVQTNQPGLIEIEPGDGSFVVQSDGAGTGGNSSTSIEYFEIAKDADDSVALTVTR